MINVSCCGVDSGMKQESARRDSIAHFIGGGVLPFCFSIVGRKAEKPIFMPENEVRER